jgi:hypothetical protein
MNTIFKIITHDDYSHHIREKNLKDVSIYCL